MNRSLVSGGDRLIVRLARDTLQRPDMAFDEALAQRIRKLLKGRKGLVEKKMFGGVGYLINGNMSVGVHGDELIVRLPADETDAALRERGARIFDLTGRPMKGWLL